MFEVQDHLGSAYAYWTEHCLPSGHNTIEMRHSFFAISEFVPAALCNLCSKLNARRHIKTSREAGSFLAIISES